MERVVGANAAAAGSFRIDDRSVGELESPDAVVAEVVQGIRAAQSRHGFALAREIGQLIVNRFHGGDIEKFRSRGHKDASLRKLAQHADLPMSASALHNAVAAFDYAERNPGVYSSKHLTPTHVRAVLALPAAQQDRLLAMAEDRSLTVEQLAVEVALVENGVRKRVGRKTLPQFVKSIHALSKYVEGDLFGGLDSVSSLDAVEAERLRRTVAALLQKCEGLMAALERAGTHTDAGLATAAPTEGHGLP